MLGPVEAVTIVLIRAVIKIPFTSTFCVGEIADLIIGIPVAIVTSLIYKKHHTKKGALISLLFGSLIWVSVSIITNIFINIPFFLELYFGGIVIFVKLCCAVLTSLYQISSLSKKTKNHTMKGVFQMLKIVVICIGLIYITSIVIDKDPTNLIAGLGASAAVLMLVFKDSIMGLVAGVQLSANDMLRPGDWIIMEKYGADGMVQDVSLTTVKVQNWDKTITTIPPYALVSESFQNWRGMFDSGGRRIKRSIFIDMNSIAFCTADQIEKLKANSLFTGDEKTPVNLTVFREWLEMWLKNHPKVNKGMITMVRQLQPTAHGLPLELYFFFDGTAWVNYEHLQAEVFEYILAIMPQFGLKIFQSPTGNDLKELTGN